MSSNPPKPIDWKYIEALLRLSKDKATDPKEYLTPEQYKRYLEIKAKG